MFETQNEEKFNSAEITEETAHSCCKHAKILKRIGIGLGCLVILAGVFIGGAYVGYAKVPFIEKVKSVFGKEDKEVVKQIDFGPFWEEWKIIEDKFIANGDTDKQKMVWGAMEGLAKSLGDPYTVYFPPKESQDFKEEMQGNFEGVGMEIGIRDDILTVVSPLEGTPAKKAGIMAGDKILKIDDKMTLDLSAEQAVKLIRGPKGTVVKLLISRKGDKAPKEIAVTRGVINIPIIKTEKKDNGVFVIKLYSFSANSPELFQKAIREFALSGSDKLILDLRGNPGGYMEAAIDMASWFLPDDKVVVKQKFADEKNDVVFKSRGYDFFTRSFQFVILINEGSASASEILAGALREHGIAKLVGQKSFGKGSVQEMVDISGGGSLKITISKWLTPNGHSITEKGIEPDVAIELKREDLEKEKDPQMDKAMEIVTSENFKI